MDNNTPETAIRCFETWSGLSVVFYDRTQCFTNCLSHRHHHRHPVCKMVKCSGAPCAEFDSGRSEERTWGYQEGAVKICQAGILELVLPIFSGERLIAILLAGIRRPPEQLPAGIPLWRAENIRPCPEKLPVIQAEEIELALEGLRQLGARLRFWYENTGNDLYRDALPRSRVIEYAIQKYARETLTLKTMAQILNVSYNRAASVIKEETGKTLRELVRAQRLQRAKILLEHTDRTVPDIAASSGYPDIANFHRQFKKSEGVTPVQYRDEIRHLSRHIGNKIR